MACVYFSLRLSSPSMQSWYKLRSASWVSVTLSWPVKAGVGKLVDQWATMGFKNILPTPGLKHDFFSFFLNIKRFIHAPAPAWAPDSLDARPLTSLRRAEVFVI